MQGRVGVVEGSVGEQALRLSPAEGVGVADVCDAAGRRGQTEAPHGRQQPEEELGHPQAPVDEWVGQAVSGEAAAAGVQEGTQEEEAVLQRGVVRDEVRLSPDARLPLQRPVRQHVGPRHVADVRLLKEGAAVTDHRQHAPVVARRSERAHNVVRVAFPVHHVGSQGESPQSTLST